MVTQVRPVPDNIDTMSLGGTITIGGTAASLPIKAAIVVVRPEPLGLSDGIDLTGSVLSRQAAAVFIKIHEKTIDEEEEVNYKTMKVAMGLSMLFIQNPYFTEPRDPIAKELLSNMRSGRGNYLEDAQAFFQYLMDKPNPPELIDDIRRAGQCVSHYLDDSCRYLFESEILDGRIIGHSDVLDLFIAFLVQLRPDLVRRNETFLNKSGNRQYNDKFSNLFYKNLSLSKNLKSLEGSVCIISLGFSFSNENKQIYIKSAIPVSLDAYEEANRLLEHALDIDIALETPLGWSGLEITITDGKISVEQVNWYTGFTESCSFQGSKRDLTLDDLHESDLRLHRHVRNVQKDDSQKVVEKKPNKWNAGVLYTHAVLDTLAGMGRGCISYLNTNRAKIFALPWIQDQKSNLPERIWNHLEVAVRDGFPGTCAVSRFRDDTVAYGFWYKGELPPWLIVLFHTLFIGKAGPGQTGFIATPYKEGARVVGQFIGGWLELEAEAEATRLRFFRVNHPGILTQGYFDSPINGPAKYTNDPLPAFLTKAAVYSDTPFLAIALKDQRKIMDETFQKEAHSSKALEDALISTMHVSKETIYGESDVFPYPKVRSTRRIDPKDLVKMRISAGLSSSYGFTKHGRFRRRTLKETVGIIASQCGKKSGISVINLTRSRMVDINSEYYLKLLELSKARNSYLSDSSKDCVIVRGSLYEKIH